MRLCRTKANFFDRRVIRMCGTTVVRQSQHDKILLNLPAHDYTWELATIARLRYYAVRGNLTLLQTVSVYLVRDLSPRPRRPIDQSK